MAEQLAEVEPFKTAIILKFVREWPFALYAVALLVAGLFVERFFCRYLCPLGAALAIPGRMRIFEWLKRWPECGTPCQRCASECPVQAIHPEGNINPNECIYCMHCQELYRAEDRCPHKIQRRLKREKRERYRRRDAPLPGARARKTAITRTGAKRRRGRADHGSMSRARRHDADRPRRQGRATAASCWARTAAAGAAGAGRAVPRSPPSAAPGRGADRHAGRRPRARPQQQHRGQARASSTSTTCSSPSGQTGEVRIVGAAVDARADAHAGVQPRQRHRLGPDQREPARS